MFIRDVCEESKFLQYERGEIKVKKQRQTELDLLRIVALLAVILVHCAGMGSAEFSVMRFENKIVIFLTSIVTWQVPVYVMISGRFFLDPAREVSGRKIIQSIKRLIVSFVIWDIVYQIYYILTGAYVGLNWKGILTQAIFGPYHFWYIFMIICLYMITPFLRKIVEDKQLIEYFIILFLLFQTLNYYGISLPIVGNIIAEVLNKANFYFALGFSGYYILGYYLYKYGVSKKMEKVLYVAAIILAIGAGLMNVHRTVIEGINEEWYTQYLMPNVAVEAVAIYLFFSKKVGKINFSDCAVKWITKLSEYSFGVYLVHALIANIFDKAGISIMWISPIVMLPIIVLLVFIISNIVVYLVRKVPYIGKKIT